MQSFRPNFRFRASILIAIASFSASLGAAFGSSEAELSAQIQNIDDSTLQKSAVKQAEAIREIPNELHAQGIQISADQELEINQTADNLVRLANQPGFKEKVSAALKKLGHGLERTGVDIAKDSAKGLGYAGNVALGISISPVTFTGDLIMGIAVGHGVFSKDLSDSTNPTLQQNVETELGLVAGITSFYYTNVGLDALGYTFGVPVIASSMGIATVSAIICARYDNKANSELDRYCQSNEKILGAILHGSARGGAILGDGIHDAALALWHLLKKPFHGGTAPTPAPSPSPSSLLSPSP